MGGVNIHNIGLLTSVRQKQAEHCWRYPSEMPHPVRVPSSMSALSPVNKAKVYMYMLLCAHLFSMYIYEDGDTACCDWQYGVCVCLEYKRHSLAANDVGRAQ